MTGYDNFSYPTSDTEIHTITYYDDYSFLDIPAIDPYDSLQSVTYDKEAYIIQNKRAGSVKGWITGTRTKVLSDVADASTVKKNILYTVIFL